MCSDSSLLGSSSPLTPAKQMKMVVRTADNSAILSVLDTPVINRKKATNPALQGKIVVVVQRKGDGGRGE